ncbi:GNAT family N-acetyltransferase [Aquicoccus sp. G2-2]|uniref:GNAT family N-acetyltransferase n=1 Tax=Aquicoccus sp. G2-2 TaxID=3092120 RepID=UPI002AE04C77|nr:GNAT family N-acetyltransferase [Aquicoccus sp. G2-2]MEA1113092.1 GNAT family N-acetyltransferase [Aquicoccus sp. G2-2]
MSLQSGFHAVPRGHIGSVVTHLEMHAKPALRPEQEVGLQLERVARAEPDWYRALFRRIGAEYLWFGRLEIDEAALCAILHDPLVEVYRVLDGNADVGLLELDFRRAGECELAYFGLVAGFAGRGAGRWMMNRAIGLAWREGVARFLVHTCSLDHPAALEFYRRSGFTACAREIEISEDPRLRGLLAETAAPGVPILR